MVTRQDGNPLSDQNPVTRNHYTTNMVYDKRLYPAGRPHVSIFVCLQMYFFMASSLLILPLSYCICHTNYFQPSPHNFWIHIFSRGLVFFGAPPSSACGPFSGSLTSTTRPLLWPGGYTAFTPGRGGLPIRIPVRRDLLFAADAVCGVLG